MRRYLLSLSTLLSGPLIFVLMLLLPRPEGLSEEAWRVLALAAFMVVWWITEGVPIPVTALLPIVMLPLLGVSSAREASAPYASPIVFLFMGGFVLALALERWQLHRRIALSIVRITGSNANGIIFGFMLATFTLSMWISNTATAVMMLPIAQSVVQLLSRERGPAERGMFTFKIALMLGIAYSANIGGTATIIGTPPNVVLVGFMQETYNYELTFAAWLPLGLTFSIILLGITYFLLVRILYPSGLGSFSGARALIDRELAELGSIGRAEKRVLTIFAATALAWIFRTQLNTLTGLSISDPEIAMLSAILLFATPLNLRKREFLLRWEDTTRLPWGILLLFGGGLSLAAALQSVGIIDLIGAQFADRSIAPVLLILGLTSVSLFLTEIMSNVALVNVFLPVVAGIALASNIPVLQICAPVTLAASCAFMLPMSTPPNAIVFASGYLRIADMVRAGVILNVITILLVLLMARTLLPLLF